MSDDFSRRLFTKAAAVSLRAAACLMNPQMMKADPLNLPIGLQLYTVGKELDADLIGTLKQVAAVGYKSVELSPMTKISSRNLRKALDDNGLKNPAGHYMLADLMSNLQQKMDAAKELGQEFMIVTVPGVADGARMKKKPAEDEMAVFLAVLNHLSLDDWKWNAEQFNKVGEQTKRSGLQLGYHNHNFEFKLYGEQTGYDEFLRLTDPELVKLELDCGWMTVAGKDPVAYLNKYPDRYRLLHVKDFKKGFAPTTALMEKSSRPAVPTELGRGAIDYTRIFKASQQAEIRAFFVEQEPPYVEMPALQAIKVDYQYLKGLPA